MCDEGREGGESSTPLVLRTQTQTHRHTDTQSLFLSHIQCLTISRLSHISEKRHTCAHLGWRLLVTAAKCLSYKQHSLLWRVDGSQVVLLWTLLGLARASLGAAHLR